MSAYSTLLTALGWALLNSIWQMATVWAGYLILTAWNKRISAAGKHDLALVFAAIGSGWMISYFIKSLYDIRYTVHPGLIPVSPEINRWIPLISCLYLLILLIRLARSGFYLLETGRNNSGYVQSSLLQTFVDRQRRLLGISKRVLLYISELTETAATRGIWKPLILLPASLLTRLSPEQLEAILIHELFHIRRNDYLINICISCFRNLLYFNPFAHFFYNEITRERENACDDEVIEKGYAPKLYAEALFCLEKERQLIHSLLVAADGNKPWLLMERIGRVLGKPAIRRPLVKPVFVMSLMASLILVNLHQIPSPPVTKAGRLVSFIPSAVYSQIEFVTPIENQPAVSKKSRSARLYKQTQKKNLALLPPEITQEEETADERVPVGQTYFAENTIANDFSNQASAGPNTESVPVISGTPFIPSASLSYENLPDLTLADSIRETGMQTLINEIVGKSRLTAKVSLKVKQTELEKNRRQLRKLEIKNKQLIIRHQRNIKPLLENMLEQLQLKKQEIDELKIRLQVTDQEIIHI